MKLNKIMENKEFVKVGVGVIIRNKEGKILIGKRKGSYASKYSIPGGSVGPGETFENTAVREIKEELNLDIHDPRVVAITNNLETYREEGIHYISVILLADDFSGKPEIMEPDKCEEWLWCDPYNLPEPHFDASKRGVDCYLKKILYHKYE